MCVQDCGSVRSRIEKMSFSISWFFYFYYDNLIKWRTGLEAGRDDGIWFWIFEFSFYFLSCCHFTDKTVVFSFIEIVIFIGTLMTHREFLWSPFRISISFYYIFSGLVFGSWVHSFEKNSQEKWFFGLG